MTSVLFSVNENISPNGIYSIETLSPSTSYNILVKCFNSAGMTSTLYTASTLTAYAGSTKSYMCYRCIALTRARTVMMLYYTICFSGNYDKEALSVNDKIMHTIYNIALMWPLALAILSLVVISISFIICYRYSKC
jgi:hypothetical protein